MLESVGVNVTAVQCFDNSTFALETSSRVSWVLGSARPTASVRAFPKFLQLQTFRETSAPAV